MKHILEKNNSSAYHLHVELDSEDLKKYIESAQKKLSESLNIKGFRKGHVPTNVVQDTVGIDRIRQEALQIAVADSLSRIVQEENIRLIRQEKFEIKENTPERLVYDMDLIIFPEIQLATYDNMDLKKRHLEVTDEEVRRVMGDVAKLRMTSRVVERPAQKGDRVTIDFEITEAGKEIEGGKEESYPLTIGDRQFIPEFEDQVIGITSGETKNFSIEVPADLDRKSTRLNSSH